MSLSNALAQVPLEQSSMPMSDLLRLDGKVAVVTGGGGVGLGSAICHRLAEQGATVAVVDVNAAASESAASELMSRWAGFATSHTADVSEWDEVQGVTTEILAEHGQIDILVNNAGGSGATSRDGTRAVAGRHFVEMSHAEIDLLARLNFLGTLYVTRSVLPSMVERGRGRVIMIASEGGKTGLAGSAVYADSKAGSMSLTRTLAEEVGPLGISTACVSPGLMLSDRHIQAIQNQDPLGGMLEEALERISLGRPGAYDEIATVVSFLASPAGAYVHGATVSVSGGMTD